MKKNITLKEFSERYHCSYSAACIRIKKLLAKDKKFAKHVIRKGRTYYFDEVAAELLKPRANKKSEDLSIDELAEELRICQKYQKELNEKIRQIDEEFNLLTDSCFLMSRVIYDVLGRDYLPGDEKRLGEYLSSCNDFKIFMDSKIEKAEECDFQNEDR